MSKEISNKINIIRVISMFLIIICHYFQYYNIGLAYWFNVGVQIFFILSAFLYGQKDIKDYKTFFKNKFFKIIIPYYIVIICFFIISFILQKTPFSKLDIFYYLMMSQAFNTSISSIAHLWFISYIMLFYLIIPLLQKFDISNQKNFYLKIFLLIVFLQSLQMLNIININISYLSLFIVTYYFSRRYFKYKIKDNYKGIYLLTLAICIIGIPIQIYLEQFNFSGILYKIYIIYHDYLHAILGINLFLLFLKYIPNINNKIISSFSKISYSVYLVHQIFLFSTYSALKLKHGIIISVILIILFSYLLYVLSNIINKKCNISKTLKKVVRR